MQIECKVYEFKKEFCQILNIPMNQVERRLDQLLEWLKNFYDYNFYKGRPNRIEILEIYGEYEPMPRKLPKQDELTKQKTKDYDEFVYNNLTPDFIPTSQREIARQAQKEFGKKKYNHQSTEAVVKRYIKDPFKRYAENNGEYIWVYSETYIPLEKDVLIDWFQIMDRERIGEKEAAKAFYRLSLGEDVSKEISYFKKAMWCFCERYGDYPIFIGKWRLKEIYQGKEWCEEFMQD